MKSFLSSFARRLIPAACLFLVPLAACTAQNDENPAGTPGPDGAVHQRWNFDTIKGWVYEHQDTASVSQCSLAGGYLIIYTRAFPLDRQKMHTYHSLAHVYQPHCHGRADKHRLMDIQRRPSRARL